jgi:hypothetical protein
MYVFISTAYLFIFPILIVILFLVPLKSRTIVLHLRSSIQLSLIVYSLYLGRQVIGLYQLLKMLKMPDANIDYVGSGLIEMILILVLPFLFLYHRILNSWKLGLVIWILLLHALQRLDWMININGWPLVNSILFYISLVSTIYALLWLLKNRSSSLAH